MLREEKILSHLGFGEKESKVYLALLELGPSTVLTLAKEAAIKRPNAYLVLEELIRKGCIRMIEKKTTTLYMAEDPTMLASRFKENLESFQELLPRLGRSYKDIESKNKEVSTDFSELYSEKEPGETIFFSGTSVTNHKGKQARKKVSGVLKVYRAEE